MDDDGQKEEENDDEKDPPPFPASQLDFRGWLVVKRNEQDHVVLIFHRFEKTGFSAPERAFQKDGRFGLE